LIGLSGHVCANAGENAVKLAHAARKRIASDCESDEGIANALNDW
jgi:hypothetical protein